MIRLYTWSTPNGVKISIALEELGLDYEVVPVDIGNHLPAIGAETLRRVVGKPATDFAVDGNVVVIVEVVKTTELNITDSRLTVSRSNGSHQKTIDLLCANI